MSTTDRRKAWLVSLALLMAGCSSASTASNVSATSTSVTLPDRGGNVPHGPKLSVVGSIVTLTPAAAVDRGCLSIGALYTVGGTLVGVLGPGTAWQEDGPGLPPPTVPPCATPPSAEPVSYTIPASLRPGAYVVCIGLVKTPTTCTDLTLPPP